MTGRPSDQYGEVAAIARLEASLPTAPRGELWIGDDAAVVAGPAGEPILLAADAVVEGVHFDLGLATPADVGWKAMAVNVSDIAAMGGRPLHALVCVVGAGTEVLEQLYEGLMEAGAAYRCDIVGGDLSDGPNLVVSVAVTGTTDGRPAITRSGASAGDTLFVTGPLGRSAAGLAALLAGPVDDRDPASASTASATATATASCVSAYRRPQAALEAGVAAALGGASAMIDVSDGLGLDLDRLATASAVGVDLSSVPIAGGATLDQALGGGDDYELVFAAPDGGAIMRAFRDAGLEDPVELGRCVADPSVRLLEGSLLAPSGWVHRMGKR